MKLKIVGFKIGKSRPTANRTFKANDSPFESNEDFENTKSELGFVILQVLAGSDFISIRRVDD